MGRLPPHTAHASRLLLLTAGTVTFPPLSPFYRYMPHSALHWMEGKNVASHLRMPAGTISLSHGMHLSFTASLAATRNGGNL